jgi:hypothetical protein
MNFLICVCLIMTGTLLLISFHQNIQIYFMKKELRKCLKVISRCKPNFKVENAMLQIKKTLREMENEF